MFGSIRVPNSSNIVDATCINYVVRQTDVEYRAKEGGPPSHIRSQLPRVSFHLLPDTSPVPLALSYLVVPCL